ncbi:MAG: aromatic acid exporter family protein [Clostridia bacterium]|nr:aromatic acid exporter family protein [Clostridia bacterium]
MKLKLGMRILKTGLGIYLALSICELLGFAGGTLAAITAVVGMQPSLKDSLNTIKNQVLATFIGCIFAIVVAYYFNGSLIMLAIAAIATIYSCLMMGWQDSITLAVITLILIGDAPTQDFFSVVQFRVTSILLGLSIAFALNIIFPPKHTHRLLEKVDELRHAFEAFYHRCVDDIVSTQQTKQEVKDRAQHIRNILEEARSIYVLSVDSKIGNSSKKEKDTYYLIRRAINAIQSNLERLLELHRSIVFAPNDEEYRELRRDIHSYLKEIFFYHQKIYDYILFDKPLEKRMLAQFAEQEKQLESKIVALVNKAHDLEPLHYYNMVAEAQRIMNKAWALAEEKEGLNKNKGEAREKSI